jgi:two-component system OmpR family response regulator
MNKGNGPKPKVLIVDDQPQMRAFLRDALEEFPVDIVEAGDGFDAMLLIETEQPDLLLSDYLMPNWDGLTLCHELRGKSDKMPMLKISKPLKIVLISGETTQPMLLEAVNHGTVDAAFHKPVDVKELRQVVKRLLALK